MRLAALISLACAATSALAWDKEDYEIFDLVSALEAREGKGTSFYSFLNVTPAASTAEVSKSYRKRSLELHPDKNPHVKDAQERFARLGTIANILRDSERRERYHHFYVNGVPTWRGTGYYYSRLRPGLATVLAALAAFSCLVQYLVQRLNYQNQRNRITTLRKRAINVAYGTVTSAKQRETRRSRIRVPKTDLDNEPRAFLMTVQGDQVWLVDEDTKEEHLLSEDELPRPRFGATWAPSLARSGVNRIVRPKSEGGAKLTIESEAEASGTETPVVAADAPGAPADGSMDTATAMAVKGAKKRKTAGRR